MNTLSLSFNFLGVSNSHPFLKGFKNFPTLINVVSSQLIFVAFLVNKGHVVIGHQALYSFNFIEAICISSNVIQGLSILPEIELCHCHIVVEINRGSQPSGFEASLLKFNGHFEVLFSFGELFALHADNPQITINFAHHVGIVNGLPEVEYQHELFFRLLERFHLHEGHCQVVTHKPNVSIIQQIAVETMLKVCHRLFIHWLFMESASYVVEN